MTRQIEAALRLRFSARQDGKLAKEEPSMHRTRWMSQRLDYEDVKFNIALVSRSSERAFAKYKASATYTFAISDGPVKTHAEVVLTDGGSEVIERKGKDAKEAARLALERLLVTGCDPFERRSFCKSRTNRRSSSRNTAASCKSFLVVRTLSDSVRASGRHIERA